jgi:hypothetical protein
METKCGYRKRTCARSSNEAETSLPIKSAADSSVPRLRGYYSSQVLTRRSRVGIVGPCLSVSNSLLRRQAIELLSLCTILTPWWRRIQWCNSPTQRAPAPDFPPFSTFWPPFPIALSASFSACSPAWAAWSGERLRPMRRAWRRLSAAERVIAERSGHPSYSSWHGGAGLWRGEGAGP